MIYIFFLGIMLSSGGWIFFVYMGSAILLAVWSAINILSPNKPYIMIVPIITYSLTMIIDRKIVEHKNEKLCLELRRDPECQIKGTSFECSQKAIKYRGMFGALKCSRSPEEQRIYELYKTGNIQKITKELKQRNPELVNTAHKLTKEAQENALRLAENANRIAEKAKKEEELKLLEKQEEKRKEKEARQTEEGIFKTLDEKGFSAFEEDELNSELFQEVLISKKPEWLHYLPKNLVFTEKPLRKAFEKYYKFSFHLPTNQQISETVIKLEKEYDPIYRDQYLKYVGEASNRLSQFDMEYVFFHPDFFHDENFTKLFLKKCSERSSSENLNYPDSIFYFEKPDVFNQKFKDDFLKAHSEINHFNIICYPKDILTDEKLVLKLANQNPYLDFTDKFAKFTKLKSLQEVIAGRKLESYLNEMSQNPAAIGKVPLDVANSEKFQAALFDKLPASIKYKDEIVFLPNLLELFISKHYKPSRFFAPSQQNKEPASTLLKKHSNASPEFLNKEKKMFTESLSTLTCCSSSYKESIKLQLGNLPIEILNDDAFHMLQMDHIRMPTAYIESLVTYRDLTPPLRNYITRKCKQDGTFKNYAFEAQYSPSFIKDSPGFFEELKAACDAQLKKKETSFESSTKKHIDRSQIEEMIKQENLRIQAINREQFEKARDRFNKPSE